MTPEHPAPLESWIRECFERLKAEERFFDSYRRLFLRELGEELEFFVADTARARSKLIDPEEPDDGTVGDSRESCAADAYRAFEDAHLKGGHSLAYSEAFGHFVGFGQNPDNAAEDAYGEMGVSFRSLPAGHPVWDDAYHACLHRGKGQRFAKHCADQIAEGNYLSFPKAFEATGKFEKEYERALADGLSEFGAVCFAKARLGEVGVGDGWGTEMAGIYARCAEQELAAGRSEDDAARFAAIYLDLYEDWGSFDENPECREILNEESCRPIAEIAFRHYPGLRALEDFSREVFATLRARPRDRGEQFGAWIDRVETSLFKLRAAKKAYQEEHGSLRGFVDEEAPVIPPIPNFRAMKGAEFESHQPLEHELDEWVREGEYRDWCALNYLDFREEANRKQFANRNAPPPGDGWDEFDEHERAGWEDNMTRSHD